MKPRILAVGLALLVTTSACSGSSASSVGTNASRDIEIKDADGLNAEYQAELRRLEFPESFRPALRAPAEQPNANYEAGLGTDSAEFQWLCAWFGEFVANRTTDPVRARHALSVLDEFPSMQLWTHMDANGRQTVMDAVAAARSGNDAGIRSQQDAMMCATG